MKERKYILMLISAAMVATMAGCSKSDTPTNPSTPDDYELSTTPIGFTAEESITKGTPVDGAFAEGNTLGVYAYYTPEGESFGTSSAPEYMNNQEVVYNGSLWSYSPVKYWPLSGNIHFFAYTPYREVVLSDQNDIYINNGGAITGFPTTIKFTPNTDVDKQCDFMVANCIQDKNINNNDISFEFKRYLTQINFAAKYDGSSLTTSETDINVLLLEVEISGLRNNLTLTLDAENKSYSVSNYGNGTSSYAIDRDNLADNFQLVDCTEGYTRVNNDQSSMLVIPQQSTQSMTINVRYMVDGVIKNVTSDLNPTDGFEVGKSYEVQFTVTVSDEDLAGQLTANVVVTDTQYDYDYTYTPEGSFGTAKN